MATITPDIRAAYGMAANLIPASTVASIDQAELLDRLVHSRQLVRKSQASFDVTVRRGYAALARAVLTAQPRATTERQHRELIAKAAGLGHTLQADALRRKAQELFEQHPTAPRRQEAAAAPIAKAAAADDTDLVPVFDQTGKLLGVVDRAKLQPVVGGAEVAKARPAPKARRAAASPVRRSPRR